MALKKDETVSASATIRATPEALYAIVSDVTRIPEWSPETKRVERQSETRFRAWNRRRLGRWKNYSDIVTREPGRRFSFVVQSLGGDWTEWSYDLQPVDASTTRLTQTCRMCVDLPKAVVVFEWVALLVPDRRPDLKANIQTSVDRIKAIAESRL